MPPWLVSRNANRCIGHLTLPGICSQTYSQAVNSSIQQEPTPTQAKRRLALAGGMSFCFFSYQVLHLIEHAAGRKADLKMIIPHLDVT